MHVCQLWILYARIDILNRQTLFVIIKLSSTVSSSQGRELYQALEAERSARRATEGTTPGLYVRQNSSPLLLMGWELFL